MTIGTLSARIMADASGIRSGMGLTRDELKLTRQAFVDSATDAEKLDAALAKLESARLKGAFPNEERYARAVAAVRAEFDKTIPVANKTADSIKEVSTQIAGTIPGANRLTSILSAATPAMAGFAAAGLALGAGAWGVKRFVNEVQDQFKQIDDIADEAMALGMKAVDLMSLHELAIATETDTGAVEKAVWKMQVKIGEAAKGTKEAVKAFGDLNLSWQDLAASSPDDALIMVAGAISRLDTEAERAAASQDILGKGAHELGRMLRVSEGDLRSMIDRSREMGRVLTEDQIERVGAADDAWRELGMAWQGIARQNAPELADAMKTVANELQRFLTNAELKKDVSDTFELATDSVSGFASAVGSIFEAWKSLPEPVRRLLGGGPIKTIMTGGIPEARNVLVRMREIVNGREDMEEEARAAVNRTLDMVDERMKKEAEAAKAIAEAQKAANAQKKKEFEDQERFLEQLTKLRTDDLKAMQDEFRELDEYGENAGQSFFEASIAGFDKTLREMDMIARKHEQIAKASDEAIDKTQQAINAFTKTDSTIEASSLASAFDAIRSARDNPQIVDRFAGIGEAIPATAADLDRFAGIGEPVPADAKQLPFLERIAKSVEAWLQKEGIVIEEVSL